MGTPAIYNFHYENKKNEPKLIATYYMHYHGYLSGCTNKILDALKLQKTNKAFDFHVAFVSANMNRIEPIIISDYEGYGDSIVYNFYLDSRGNCKNVNGTDLNDFVNMGLCKELRNHKRIYNSRTPAGQKFHFKNGEPNKDHYKNKFLKDYSINIDFFEYSLNNINIDILKDIYKLSLERLEFNKTNMKVDNCNLIKQIKIVKELKYLLDIK